MIKDFIFSVYEQLSKARASKYFKIFTWDVLSKGTDFVLLPIYLKVLSQEEYGFYTYTLYVITTISGIIKLGLDTSVSKMYYENDMFDRRKMLFSISSVWFTFFIAFLSFSLFTDYDKIIFSKLLNISEASYLQIRIFLFSYIFFFLIQSSINVFFVIDEKALSYQKYNLIRTVVGNCIVILLLYFFAKVDKAYFRLTVEPFVYILSFIPLSVIFLKQMTFKIDFTAIKHGLQIGVPMVGTLIVGVVNNISDKYFLQKSQGYDILAIYNLALFLALPISLIFSSFNSIWLPKFFKEKSTRVSFRLSNSFFKKLTTIYLVLLIILESGIFFLLKSSVLSAEYFSLLLIFPIVYFAKIADNLISLYNNFIIIWSKTGFNFIATILFSILTFIFNLYFIPVWGLFAAVFLMLFISIARLVVFFAYVKRSINHEHNSKV